MLWEDDSRREQIRDVCLRAAGAQFDMFATFALESMKLYVFGVGTHP